MLEKYHRYFAGVVLFLIVIYGILKIWVLRIFANLLELNAQVFGFKNNWLFETVRDQAIEEAHRQQTLGWLIYYPSYFLLHILFIYLLFNNKRKARNYLMIGLTTLITVIIGLWVFFKAIDQQELAYFLRTQFKNLFGLPFILLVIEGGRILYTDIEKRFNQ